MKKIRVFSVAVLLFACTPQEKVSAAPKENLPSKGITLILDALRETDCPRLFDMYTQDMKSAFPQDQNATFCNRSAKAMGDILAATLSRRENDLEVYRLETAGGVWGLKVARNSTGLISSFSISPVGAQKDVCSELLISSTSHVRDYLKCRREDKVPALGLWVYHKGQVRWFDVDGVRVRGKADAAKKEDLWHIGSCGKALNSTLAGILVQEGRLRFESTVCEALKKDIPDLHSDFCGVTLAELLAHQGGLPGVMPKELFNTLRRDWRHGSKAERLRVGRSLLSEAPSQAPGSGMVYSNSGYIIAALLMERIAGEDWETLIEQKILKPLAMTTTGYGPPLAEQPQGHFAHNGKPAGHLDNPGVYSAAGGFHMSLEDWGRFVLEQVKAEQREGAVLKQATAHRLHQPFGGSNYALGWGTSKHGKHRVLSHMGSNTMWYSYVVASPGQDFIMLAVTNAGSPNAGRMLQQVGKDVGRALLGD